MMPDFRAPSTLGVRQALLNTIYGTESPAYNVMYGGQRFYDYSQHPNIPVLIENGPNAGKYSTAAGKPQFLKGTWDELQQELNLPDFSPESQDKAAWHLADKTYRQKTGGYLEDVLAAGDPNEIAGVGRALSGKWTSLPGGIEQAQGDESFVSAYNDARGRPQQDTQMANYTLVERPQQSAGGGNYTLVERPAKQGNPAHWGMFPQAMDTLTMGGATKLNAAGIGAIEAGIGALQGKGWNYSEPYNRELEQQRADQAAYQEQHPDRATTEPAWVLALELGNSQLLVGAYSVQSRPVLVMVLTAVRFRTRIHLASVGGILPQAAALVDYLARASILWPPLSVRVSVQCVVRSLPRHQRRNS